MRWGGKTPDGNESVKREAQDEEDQPEGGDGPGEETRTPELKRAECPQPGEKRKCQRDDGHLSHLHPEVEGHEACRQRRAWQVQLLERASEAKAMHQPEGKGD